jgi:hypothetical protein
MAQTVAELVQSVRTEWWRPNVWARISKVLESFWLVFLGEWLGKVASSRFQVPGSRLDVNAEWLAYI